MAQLRQFFEEYATALSSSDIEAIAGAYADQFIATGPGFRTTGQNDNQFRHGLRQAAHFYRQTGMRAIAIKNYLEAELGSNFWLVKIEWKLVGEDDSEIVTFDNTYFVENADPEDVNSKPQIILFVAHNEQQRMQEKGLIPGS